MRLKPGDRAPVIKTQALNGEPLNLPDAHGGLTHLQFRRFAGCPVCNFHLMQMSRRHDEIRACGIRQVVVFHSSREEMQSYQAHLPFVCVPDPAKAHYRAYGAETSWAALANPMILWKGLRWILASRRFYQRAENGILGLPADFLIGADGRVLACHYGAHADDQWDTVELLRQVESCHPAGMSPA